MKMNNPVHINLKDFFLKGQFDCIKVGQTKEWILNNFPDPYDISDMGNSFSILRYGWIEFHFDYDKLFLIWCDSLPSIKDSKIIKYEKWILENLSKMTLEETQKKLNLERVNYSVKFDVKSENAIIKIRSSEVKLWFRNNTEKKIENFNEYKLFAFGKSDKEYDNYDRDF